MSSAGLKKLESGKLYYTISEVCGLTGLEQHVLRYWESEFPMLKPKKSRSGIRAYRDKEIKIIRYIKFLLYEEMYTIHGARKKMTEVSLAEVEGQVDLLRQNSDGSPSVKPVIAEGDATQATQLALPGLELLQNDNSFTPMRIEKQFGHALLKDLREIKALLQSNSQP